MKKNNGLALNGGGANGLISAHSIKAFEDLSGIRVIKHFDIIAGASTGALQTALLVCGYSGNDIVYIFQEEVPKIFDKEFLRFGIFRSKYSNAYIQDAVKSYTKGVKLGDLSTTIIIPTYNATQNKTKLFKSCDDKDKNFLLSDVVLASAAAPTYFDAHKIGNEYYEDGGLGYNNPSDLVLKQMQSQIKSKNYTNFQFNVLSLTTGFRTEQTKYERIKKGIAGRAQKTFENVLREQDLKVHNNMVFDYKHNVNGIYTRVEAVKKHSALKIDDGSKKNVKAMLLDGGLTYEEGYEDIKEFFINTL